MIAKLIKRFSSVRLQLVFSVFLWISPALVLTYLVNQDWFWRYAPEWLRHYSTSVPLESFIVGVLALIAALFFMAVDGFFAWGIREILGLAKQ